MAQRKLEKLSPVRLFEQASEQIRELIANNSWAKGEKLPNEQELSKQLNVSRSSVREALRILEAEGLVEAKRGLGTYVVDTPEQKSNDLAHWLEQREETLEQLLQIREYLEGLSASLAASCARDDDLQGVHALADDLYEKIAQMDWTDDSATDELAELDAAFHLAISEIGGNNIVHEMISYIIPAFNKGNKALLYLRHRTGILESEHREIVAAIESRDPERAEKTMRSHIRRVRKDIVEFRHQ